MQIDPERLAAMEDTLTSISYRLGSMEESLDHLHSNLTLVSLRLARFMVAMGADEYDDLNEDVENEDVAETTESEQKSS